MNERDPLPWPPAEGAAPGADSIAAEVASRISAAPPAPGDAMDWASIAARYEREAHTLGAHPAAAELLHEAGRIYAEHLGDDEAALEFHRRALAADPAFLPAVRAARRLALDRGEDALAAELLEAEAAALPDPAGQAELLLARSRLLSWLGRAAEAEEALARARALAPGTYAVAEEDVRAAARAGDRAALAEASVRSARATSDARLAAHHLSAAAAVVEEALGDAARAGALALEAAALSPDDPLLRAAARRDAERLGQDEVLAALLREEAAAARGPAAVEALRELARIEERLGRGEGALAALEQARAGAPEDPAVLADLARLREARGEWDAASEALEALARALLAQPDEGRRLEAVAARLRRAELEEERLGAITEAIHCHRQVLALEPGHRPALSALGRLCARAGDWEGLLAAFEAEAAAARDPRERAQRIFKAAEVLEERLARPEDAAARYRAALEADPDLLSARVALERVLTALGRWDAVAGLLEEELARVTAPSDRAAQLVRLGRLREDRLGDLAGAADAYRAALALEPATRVAGPALAAALERLGRHGEAAELVLDEARLATDLRRRVALLQRRAELLDRPGGDPELAAAAWDEVQRAAPGHLPALRALGRLHARAGRWEAVVALFREEADAAADAAVAADRVLRVGEILERKLDRPDAAVAAYREVLTLDPENLPALLALARLYRARGDHESLVDVLRAQAGLRTSPAARAATLVEEGRLCEERLGDRERAREAYEEALRAIPGHPAAVRALERHHAAAGRAAALAELRRASEGADPERLLALARLEADRMDDPRAALRAAERLAEAAPGHPAAALLVVRLSAEPARRAAARVALASSCGDPAAAAALLVAAALEGGPPLARRTLLSRAAALAPDGPLLAPEEERRLREAGDPAALAAFCAGRAERAPDRASRVAWWVRAGEAFERAGEPRRALEVFQAALAAAPSHLPALRAARSLFARERDWGAARATLQAEGATLQDAHEAAAAWAEAGALAERHFGDAEGAAEDYRRAAERDPAHPVALTRLEALLATRGGAAVAALHEARARAARTPREAAEAWVAAARASHGAPEGRDRALEALDRAVEAAPDHAAALELRARLRADAGRAAEAVADAEACLALGGEAPVRVPLHLLAAGLCQDAVGEPARALAHLEAALALAPEHAPALDRLAQLHRAEGRLAEAAAAYARLGAVAGLERADRLRVLLAVAEIEAERGDVEAAAAACRQVVEAEPGHAAALRLLVRLEERRGDPGGLAAALEAAAATAAPGDAAELHLGAARLHAGPLRQRHRAAEHLRAALEADPGRDDVRALLAEVSEESAPALAADCHRRLLAGDPLRVASWSALFRIFERTRAHDRAYVTATVLRWLGAPLPSRSAEPLLDEGDRQALGPPPPLPAGDWDLLRAPGDAGPVAEVIAAAGDWLGAAAAEGAEPRGAPLRADHPFRRLLADLGRSVGAADHELFGAPLGRIWVEPGLPAAVRVGADLARRTTAREQRFLLGRIAARLRARSALAEAVPPARLGELVAAAVRQVVPGYAGTGRPPEELVKELARALPRRARKALEEPARALAEQRPPPDLAAWRAAAAATADRAGLVLCGDVPTALALLLREGPAAPEGADPAARLRARPDAAALLAFAATDAHFALRQRMRVAIA